MRSRRSRQFQSLSAVCATRIRNKALRRNPTGQVPVPRSGLAKRIPSPGKPLRQGLRQQTCRKVRRVTTAYINRIATAVPPHDVHETFIRFAESMFPDDRGPPRRISPHGFEIRHRASLFISGAGRRSPTVPPSTATNFMCVALFRARRNACASSKTTRRRSPRARSSDCGLATKRRDHASPHYLLHRPFIAGARSRIDRALRALSECRALDHRLHGLLCGDQCLQACPPYRALRAQGPRPRGQSRNVHLASAGNADLETILSFLLWGDGCAASLITGRGGRLGTRELPCRAAAARAAISSPGISAITASTWCCRARCPPRSKRR